MVGQKADDVHIVPLITTICLIEKSLHVLLIIAVMMMMVVVMTVTGAVIALMPTIMLTIMRYGSTDWQLNLIVMILANGNLLPCSFYKY